jgi:hypothetical protein
VYLTGIPIDLFTSNGYYTRAFSSKRFKAGMHRFPELNYESLSINN